MTARRSLPALWVGQWLPEWETVNWNPDSHQSEPPPGFYQFSISARDLRALSGVYRRTRDRASATDDLGIQRRHERTRSREIGRFVRFGYPWSKLTDAQRRSGRYRELRKPGWLPTAIIVNVLTADQSRDQQTADPKDLITINGGPGSSVAEILLPAGFDSEWRYRCIPPIEVIDGQHRLWAFGARDTNDTPPDFEVPVVAFHGLDLSWQAYLFYTINIKPKRINPSIAFDLYPLLRTEQWLEKAEGHRIYRDTRAQELTDTLWAHPKSPWCRRINMLGEPGFSGLQVTQAAWIRSLTSSFIKHWEGPGVKIGGLFGMRVGQRQGVLPWSRQQQAAFLIAVGRAIREAVIACTDPWAQALRKNASGSDDDDAAFLGQHNLLNQDQGIRVLLQILNDLHFVSVDDLALYDLRFEGNIDLSDDVSDEPEISDAIVSLCQQSWYRDFVTPLAQSLARYDWRSSKAPGLSRNEQTLKASFRGNAGYRDFREHMLNHLIDVASAQVSHAARDVLDALGYAKTTPTGEGSAGAR